MTAGPLLDDVWDDWKPIEQTALGFLLEQDGHEDLDEEDDDDDEWNPVCQGAAVENEDGPAEEAEEDDADEDSDSDWAPEVQGAANVEKSEEEALKVLLQPNFVKETSAERQGTVPWVPVNHSNQFAGTFPMTCGVMWSLESRRPPTWEEVKSEMPRGPEVDPDLLEAPSYKDMSQEEALDLVRR
eukprot:symbB.v1.2.038905.t1/scaffold6234.1/size19801/2